MKATVIKFLKMLRFQWRWSREVISNCSLWFDTRSYWNNETIANQMKTISLIVTRNSETNIVSFYWSCRNLESWSLMNNTWNDHEKALTGIKMKKKMKWPPSEKKYIISNDHNDFPHFPRVNKNLILTELWNCGLIQFLNKIAQKWKNLILLSL